jgi:hypothetical protein
MKMDALALHPLRGERLIRGFLGARITTYLSGDESPGSQEQEILFDSICEKRDIHAICYTVK